MGFNNGEPLEGRARTIKAIRDLAQASAEKHGLKVGVEILE